MFEILHLNHSANSGESKFHDRLSATPKYRISHQIKPVLFHSKIQRLICFQKVLLGIQISVNTPNSVKFFWKSGSCRLEFAFAIEVAFEIKKCDDC